MDDPLAVSDPSGLTDSAPTGLTDLPPAKVTTAAQDVGQQRVQRALFYAVLVLVVAGVYLIARPFLVPLGWAAILAICCWPVHARLAVRIPGPLAAAISTVVVTLVLVVPTVLLGIALAHQGADAVDRVQGGFAAGIPEPLATGYAWLGDLLPLPPLEELRPRAEAVARDAAGVLAKQAGSILGAVVVILFEVGVMVLALFFFLRDGPSLVAAVRRLLPFDESHRERLMRGTHDLIHASVTSGVVVAAVQGMLGGILFACLGIGSPVFWGVVMGFLSLFPLIGSWLVWGPAAVWLLSTGHVAKGVVLLVLGAVLVGGVDNVLRPVLIGNRTSMGMLPLFIGLLGGVGAFGFIGLVLGPVLLAVAISLFQTYTAPATPASTPAP